MYKHGIMAHKKHGFTLIEMLLVVVIAGVLVAISMPSFVRSIRGNRLRSAARTVAASGRYARSIAVLHQRPVAVTFLLDGGKLVVDLLQELPLSDDTSGDAAGDEVDRQDAMPDEPVGAGLADQPVIRIERVLDGVRIVRVHISDRSRLERSGDDGQRIQVIYGSNGRCLAHEIVLEDDDGLQLVVAVDVLGVPR
jgi:prepilin-type N-terminal cleavage/methylation domain-containing protein